MANLGFSTMKTKGSAATDPQISDRLKKISESFRASMNASSQANPARNIITESRMLNSERLIYSEEVIPIVIGKKGKKLGKTVYREGTISKTDLLKFTQKTHNKSFATPLDFVGETIEEYQALPKEQKKTILAWNSEAKEIAGLNYRIRFRRYKPEQEGPSDTAFYFQNPQGWKKMMNFLKGIKLLEAQDANGQASFHDLLKSLSIRFKIYTQIKFFKALAARDLMEKSILLQQFNQRQLKNLTAQWKLLAIDRNEYNKRREEANRIQQEDHERRNAIERAVNKSPLLADFNYHLMTIMSQVWNNKALERAISGKEDINILFNALELPSAITSPSVELKMEVKLLKELPDSVIVNGKALTFKQTKPREFTLSCLQRAGMADNPEKNAKYWRIVAGSGDLSEEQKKFVQESYVPSTVNLEGEKFSLHFQDFPLDYLDNIKINLSVEFYVDVKVEKRIENKRIQAKLDTSLKGLRLASKKGKNVWLCMSTNGLNIENLPLLHLKIESRVARNAQERKQLAGRAGNFAKFANTNVIEDTFYNYSFRVPNVTPERAPLLELLPTDWKIMDPNTRKLNQTQASRAEFIQRIKYKLSKHYHETASRQIALLNKSAYVWTELQNDVMNYFPTVKGKKEKSDRRKRSELFADENYITLVTQGEDDQEDENDQNKVSGFFISYLFKRDLWESKEEWRKFYLKLKELCQMGLPPQNRLDIWSEMSRVVYFIEFTEKEGFSETPRQTPRMNRSMGISIDDVPIRSRKVYELLKESSQKNFSIFYQNLADDIQDLRASFNVSKLPYEHNLTHICRTFIYWAKFFNDPSKPESSQYLITYSRTIATLCYGFLVCQTCNFLEGNVEVEEHKIFWLLISLVTYILSSYFETNEKAPPVDTLTFRKKEDLSRRRNVLTQSALRCNQIKGIKSDLLVLKFLLKDAARNIVKDTETDAAEDSEEERIKKEKIREQKMKKEKVKKVYEKFEELGLPLEYYFGDHMLSLFFNLFNPGLTFRIWDVLFLEGSSANQVKCNRMIVCVLYTLLQECADQIVEAREGADIKFIIEMYARFQTSYGEFLDKCYESCQLFEQTIPNSDDFKGKLNLIKYAFFSDEYNRIDKATQNIERAIETHYKETLSQNLELFKFTAKPCVYNSGSDPETLSYPILAQMIQSFIAAYGNPINTTSQQNIPASERDRKLLKESMFRFWIKIYKIASTSKDVRTANLKIMYDTKEFIKNDCTPSSVNLEEEITAGAGREIKIEVSEEGSRQPIKTKLAIIDLKAIPVNVMTKLNLKLNDEDPNNASEIEVAILIDTLPGSKAYNKAAGKGIQPLQLRDLEVEDIRFNDVNIQSIQRSFASEIKADKNLGDKFSVLKRSPAAWKENFAMTVDEFTSIMRNVAPFWTESELRGIHKSITRASRNSVFYISDFFVLLILYVKGTINQKYGLLFDLFTSFDAIQSARATEVSLHDLKGLACHLYDLFMIHIPYNQLENMIDLAATGHASCIKQVIINEQIEGAKIEYPRQALNKISNFVHLNSHSKDIPIQTAEILKLLRKIYENEILPSEEGRRSWLAQNTFDIIYFTDGRNHRMTLYVDQNWKPQEQEAHQHNEAVLKLLDCFRNVLPLTTFSSLYNKDQFIEILQRLPLMNYLCSFENIDSAKTYALRNDIKFTVLMGNDPLIAVIPSNDPVHPKEKFAEISRKWPIICQAIRQPSSPLKIGKEDDIYVPAWKLDAFLPLSKILRNIKRSAMRKFVDNYNQNQNQNQNKTLGSFQSHHYNKDFYNLDYDIIIKVDNEAFNIKIDPNSTPFLVIMDLIGKGLGSDQRQNYEIVFSLKNSRIRDTYRDQYDQLAMYLHADGSSEWLPCKITYKFQFGQVNDKIDSSIIDGYGVIFERFPGETYIKKASDVIISQQIDLDELLFKRVDKTTYIATTVDQITTNLERSSTFSRANDPNQRSQGYPSNNNQFDDPLTRNTLNSQRPKY